MRLPPQSWRDAIDVLQRTLGKNAGPGVLLYLGSYVEHHAAGSLTGDHRRDRGRPSWVRLPKPSLL